MMGLKWEVCTVTDRMMVLEHIGKIDLQGLLGWEYTFWVGKFIVGVDM